MGRDDFDGVIFVVRTGGGKGRGRQRAEEGVDPVWIPTASFFCVLTQVSK